MISRSAINQYLARPVENHDWMKALSHEDLDKYLAQIEPTPRIVVPFNQAQKVCFILGVLHPQFLFTLDMGCVDCETEYLSPTGWRRIDQYNNGEVAQYKPDTEKAEFVRPNRFIKAPCEWMYRFKTNRNGLDQKLSTEHKVLYVDRKGSSLITTAGNIYDKEQTLKWGWEGRFITSFDIDIETELPLTEEELRVQVAVIADGTFPQNTVNNLCYLQVKKERKKERIRQLLRNANILWTEKDIPQTPGKTTFRFRAPRKDKIFNEWYWQASHQQLEIIADECIYWDGHESVFNYVGFYTREKESANFIQYAFSATNKPSRLFKRLDTRDNKIDYSVISGGQSKFTWLRGVDKDGNKKNNVTKESTTDGMKYCFEVPSGFLVLRRNGCVFVTGNCGKTGLTLELLRWYFDAGILTNVLILAPTDEIVLGWEDEIKRWKIDIPYQLMLGSGQRKWDMLESFDYGLSIASYMGWSTMTSRKVTEINKRTDKKETHYKPDKELLKLMAQWFDGLVLDETTRGPAQRKNLMFRAIKPVSESAKVCFGLVGRLFGKDPMPVWGQFYLIDQGASFGDTLGKFREVFFTSKRGYFGGTEYKFIKEREPDLYRFIANRSIYFNIDEVADLPETTRIRHACVFPEDTEVYYRNCVKELISLRGRYREMKNTFLRMRQISSGFVGVIDDEEGETANIEFPDNPKLDLLLEIIEELPAGRKAIVFHEFNWSGAKISEALTTAKIKHARLWGGTKNWEKIKRDFNNDPDFRVLVVGWRKGAYGLNLQQANYAIFFESPLSIIDREQCERRIRRQGQRWPVFFIDLVTRGSVDDRILQGHQTGRDFWNDVMRNPSLLEVEGE